MKILTTRKILMEEYKLVIEKLKVISIDDERYELLIKEKQEILEKISNNEKYIRENLINVSTFFISTIVYIKLINKTFEFDKENTITSTLGRNITNGLIPKFLMKK